MNKFDEYIVAYIDILGTSEKIKNDTKNIHFELLRSIYNKTNDEIDAINKLNNALSLPEKLGFKIFSDNILVYIKYKHDFYSEHKKIFDPRLQSIAMWVARFQTKALTKGLLTRGAITRGEFYIDENFVYGKALLEAVKLEENIAIYPRVIINPEIIQAYFSSTYSLDIDGLYFVNYIQSLWIDLSINDGSAVNVCTHNKLVKAKQHLLSLYTKEVDQNIKICQKYQWLIHQYNTYCKKVENGEIKKKLEKNMSFDNCYITEQDLEHPAQILEAM